ncbi:MAG TPA: amidase family protein [Rhizomicrobium sp.]|nr:amidase family protein [Rhizomicrobium sp.]
MAFAEYGKHDGLGLGTLVREKQVSALELVDEAIARAERINPKINAIIFKAFDVARDTAKKAVPDGPFSGVPMLLKDMRAGAIGMPTRSGSRLMPPILADHDATLVRRYRAASLVPLGKTNVPEFGILPVSESKLYGAARNPWNTEHTPGGSSGGSAAAVAAGIVPLAHATDGGGSIRIPASCCGLVGLKVSRGRITQGPDNADSTAGLSVDNCVTRTVRDTAAMLDLSCPPDLSDPYFAPAPQGSYLEGIGSEPRRLKIAVATSNYRGAPFHPDVAEAMQKTVKLCEQLGHVVEEAKPALDSEEMTTAFMTLWATATAFGVETLAFMTKQKPSLENIEGLTMGLYERGKTIPAVRQIWAQQTLYRIARIMGKFHEQYDLWLTPTLAQPPLRIGTIDIDEQDVEAAFAPIIDYVPFTATQNATGQPAINLPMHWNKANLPIGVQFVARSGDEMTLLKLAAQIEAAQPWFDKYPQL